MATKRGTRRRRRKEEVVEEPIVEEELTDEDDYTTWNVPDLRSELKSRELDEKGRKSVLVKRLLADDAREEVEEEEVDEDEDEVEEDEEEEEAPVQVKRTRTRIRKPAPPLPSAAETEEVTPAVAEIVTDGTPLSELTMAIITTLRFGETVNVTARPDGYSLFLGDKVVHVTPSEGQPLPEPAAEPKAKGLRGDEFYQEVWTPEYWSFMKEDAGKGKPWEELDADDKYDLADELDLEWEEHDDSKVDMMRLVKALFTEMGIVKYKDAYKSPAARKALR